MHGRFPDHGALLRQTKGQHLGAAHKRHTGLGRLLKLMQIARPDQPQDKSAHNKPRILAYEIATTREVPKCISLDGIKFPG